MIQSPSAEKRGLRIDRLACDLAVVGGGLAGVCCAVTAARAGVKVVLIQDRPVLGGNASSEVRLWILGATSHMGNNNRWAREGGVIDEILVENTYRNPEGNPLILDAILLEKVVEEPNIALLLNTAVHDLEKLDADTIQSVRAFCSQNSTDYEVTAPLFCDASGDGILGFLAGAAFRMGTESRTEFGELFAPETASEEMLGHSLYFYSKDTGRPVRFIPPSFAITDITRIPRWRDFSPRDSGCRLWWLEWGGRLDTVHESETIKWELWRVAYGVWNYIKNSGRFPEAETLTLEWVGTIPGKRESRRFEGDYILTQHDIVDRPQHADAISFGGWAIDLHPADGVFSEKPGCTQWHSKGVYEIPYRCLYSRNIANLFLAGRTISASHVAFGSTRVMATCGHNAQAVGVAAAMCIRQGMLPRALASPPSIDRLQQELLQVGQFIPGVSRCDANDLACQAAITASSRLQLAVLRTDGTSLALTQSWAMMLPVLSGPMPTIGLTLDAVQATRLQVELRTSSRPDQHTPDATLATLSVPVPKGEAQHVELRLDVTIDVPRYVFVCLMPNDAITVHLSDQRVTGVLSLVHRANRAVAKSAVQDPPPNIGISRFGFWTPERRPGGKNFAISITPALDVFGVENLINGIGRPTCQPNAWVAGMEDEHPTLTLAWKEPQTIARVELGFDADYDHPMESVLMGHPESIMPFCVQKFLIGDGRGAVLADVADNHMSRYVVRLAAPVITNRLVITLAAPSASVPAALFEVRCYPT